MHLNHLYPFKEENSKLQLKIVIFALSLSAALDKMIFITLFVFLKHIFLSSSKYLENKMP